MEGLSKNDDFLVCQVDLSLKKLPYFLLVTGVKYFGPKSKI